MASAAGRLRLRLHNKTRSFATHGATHFNFLFNRYATSMNFPQKQPTGTPTTNKKPSVRLIPATLTAILFFTISPSAFAQTPTPPTSPTASPQSEIILRDALIIDRVGQYGRSPIHTDAIEEQIVRSTWQPPTDGVTVTLPDGSTRSWKKSAAAEDGWLRHDALGGGYAFFNINSNADRTMLLHARGHNCVYINTELRTGDPYNNGYVVLPIQLRKGDNQFLFQCTRGQLWARLTVPDSPITFSTADITLPDAIIGEPLDAWGSVMVINASDKALGIGSIFAKVGNEPLTGEELPTVAAMSVRKVPFHVRSAGPVAGPVDGSNKLKIELGLRLHEPELPAGTIDAEISLNIVSPDQPYKRTFISAIDGSVQYFAVRRQNTGETNPANPPALIFTLHGASVEAFPNQIGAYRSKDWAVIVAPTNRRPFGFDWEDWGRLDAMEVLEIAQRDFHIDPRRTFLTGHSMGGHGTWNIGVTFPDRIAAIGPSAGWISFSSYTGAARYENADAVQQILLRAASASDTLSLSRNFLPLGIYILHGDADDNVPVDQARQMRKHLADFHPDFAYHEQPGAGHWWGDACVDWPPMMAFFQHHQKPEAKNVNRIEFRTASPGISAHYAWATIESQIHAMQVSSITLTRDPAKRSITGNTENVARLSFAMTDMEPGPMDLELDGQKFSQVAQSAAGERLWLQRSSDTWSVAAKPSPAMKGPHRSGPFKDAFRNRMTLVYGTSGTAEETAWSFAKARYDAETFWYRGNGSVDVVADTEFDPTSELDRNVILYGNADSNFAWNALLGTGPIKVKRGLISIGAREIAGEDSACLFIQPRQGSDTACIGAVSGSGIIGFRLTDRLPYFVSGVAYPDCIVIGADALNRNTAGIRVAGFFGNDWSIENGDFAWQN